MKLLLSAGAAYLLAQVLTGIELGVTIAILNIVWNYSIAPTIAIGVVVFYPIFFLQWYFLGKLLNNKNFKKEVE
tara:strand:+ start:178 stop:399 length:222 start_codon:yes stop_codon:yes gene_type:complete